MTTTTIQSVDHALALRAVDPSISLVTSDGKAVPESRIAHWQASERRGVHARNYHHIELEVGNFEAFEYLENEVGEGDRRAVLSLVDGIKFQEEQAAKEADRRAEAEVVRVAARAKVMGVTIDTVAIIEALEARISELEDRVCNGKSIRYSSAA